MSDSEQYRRESAVSVRSYETILTAMELTSALVAIHNNETPEKYLRVELATPDGDRAWVTVKIDPKLYRESSDLADGTELIRCRTPAGFRVDFVSPKPAHRNADRNLKAEAFVGDGAFDT